MLVGRGMTDDGLAGGPWQKYDASTADLFGGCCQHGAVARCLFYWIWWFYWFYLTDLPDASEE